MKKPAIFFMVFREKFMQMPCHKAYQIRLLLPERAFSSTAGATDSRRHNSPHHKQTHQSSLNILFVPDAGSAEDSGLFAERGNQQWQMVVVFRQFTCDSRKEQVCSLCNITSDNDGFR